jgi:hypothetical protein
MEKQGKFVVMNLVEFMEWIFKINVFREIKLIQNHHTYIPSYIDFNNNNYFTLLCEMEDNHIKRGFMEIAQNITTFPDGKIALCRDIDKVPAGIKGANIYGICIENIGNFDINGDKMLLEHKKCIIKLNAILCKRFNLTPSIETIVYHNWYDLVSGIRANGTGQNKSCPGTNFFGGNSIEGAKKNFIPLIIRDMKKIK